MKSMRLARHAGITYRQLDHWTRQGWVRVDVTGSGNERNYTNAEVAVAVTIAALIRTGFTAAAAARMARESGADQ